MPVDRSQPVYPPSKGEDILATWGDAVSDHVVQRFVSAADRDLKWANVPKGALCVTLDTLTLWKYDGTNWVNAAPPPPPSGAKGFVAIAQDWGPHDHRGGNWLGHPRLDVTWTAEPGRWYKVTHQGLYGSGNSPGSIAVRFMNRVNGTNVDPKIRSNITFPAGLGGGVVTGVFQVAGGGAVVTSTEYAEGLSGMGAIRAEGGGTYPVTTWIEDVGPV